MIQIADRTYTVPPPGGMRSFALQQRIIPVAGRIARVFVRLMGVGDVGDLLGKNVMAVLPDAMPLIGEIFAEMPPGELEAITRTMLGDPKLGAPENEVAVAVIGGAKMPLFGGPSGVDAFDAIMRGRTLEVWQLLWHALEVWYPDFFARGRALLVRQSAASPSAESSTSGQPGPASA